MNAYLSVKEYAALHGITEQAVYKNIRTGRLAAEDRIIDGKCKKVIPHPGQDPDLAAGRQGSADPAADPHPGPDPDLQQLPFQDPQPAPGSADPAADPHPGPDPDLAAAFPGSAAGHQETAALEAAIAALTKQLEEKDKQIERLMVLLDQQQKLQAQSHYLLGTADQAQPAPGSEDPAADPHPGQDPDPQQLPSQDPQPAEPPKKKRSFWSWLFE